jgi:4-hydroxy-3-polyprenylbenzoate decarboxylase
MPVKGVWQMSYHNMHEFVCALESRQELRRIQVEVNPDLEIAEITRSVSGGDGPALLFENVKGVGFPILTNVFGTFARMKFALGLEDFEGVTKEISELFCALGHEISFADKMMLLSRLAKVGSLFSRRVRFGSCKDVIVRRPSFDMLPAIKCLPEETGRSMSLCSCFVVPATGGMQHVSVCKVQVFDGLTAGIKWSLHDEIAAVFSEYKELGKAMEVAIVLGGEPAAMYSASISLPRYLDKMIFAGLLKGSAVELVKCDTVNIWVPAHSEIVLEGYVKPSDWRNEEAFESCREQWTVFNLRHITYRKNAICPVSVSGMSPSDTDFMAKATERIFLPLLRLQLPELVEFNSPLEGVLKGCVIVSIKKRYPGHARKVMHALWGLQLTMLANEIVVVDDSVDPHDTSLVVKHVLSRVDFDRDLEVIRGPVGESNLGYGLKIGIDATAKMPVENQRTAWMAEKCISRDCGSSVKARWISYRS